MIARLCRTMQAVHGVARAAMEIKSQEDAQKIEELRTKGMMGES
jgi:hypothetical protein